MRQPFRLLGGAHQRLDISPSLLLSRAAHCVSSGAICSQAACCNDVSSLRWIVALLLSRLFHFVVRRLHVGMLVPAVDNCLLLHSQPFATQTLAHLQVVSRQCRACRERDGHSNDESE